MCVKGNFICPSRTPGFCISLRHSRLQREHVRKATHKLPFAHTLSPMHIRQHRRSERGARMGAGMGVRERRILRIAPHEVHRTDISCTSCGRTEREGHEREVRLEGALGVQAGRFPETLPYDDFQETQSQPRRLSRSAGPVTQNRTTTHDAFRDAIMTRRTLSTKRNKRHFNRCIFCR